MPEVIFYNEVVLDRETGGRLHAALAAASQCMGKDGVIRLSFVDNKLVVETKGMTTVIEPTFKE